jgi:hypothetical protein
MKSRINVTVLFFALLLMVISSPAKEKPGTKKGLSKVTAGQPYVILSGNNATAWARSDGFFPAIVANSWNGEFPKGSGVGNIYQEGIVFGGFVNDGLYANTLRVTGDTYFLGMQPGAMNSDGTVNPNDPGDAGSRAFVVRGDMPPTIESDPAAWPDLTQDAAAYNMIPQASVTDGMKSQVAASYFTDWKEWPAAKGAPWYIDTVKQVRYDAAFDHTNPHDIPGIPGATQTMWFVCNDENAGQTGQFAGSPPIGMEEQMTMWSYASSTPLNNIIFKQIKLIYKGNPGSPANSSIDSMYVVQWSDPDDGDSGDDYSGSDSTLNLNYVYNSKTVDAKYAAVGLPCPAVGYVFLQGVSKYTGDAADSAIVDFRTQHGYKYFHQNNGLPTPLTSAVYFAAGTAISDPDNAAYSGTQQWYNLMRGDLPRPQYPAGTPFYTASGYASAHGIVTNYALSGDPTTGQGWIDGLDVSAGDRRLVTTHGPFTMNKGDTAEVVVALVDGIGADNIGSVKVLKYNVTYAQFAFNNNFILPAPPPSPKPSVSALDGKVVLNWSADINSVNAIESSDNNGFTFEGYNVYQLPSPSATIDQGVRIATYDVVDNVTVIVAPTLDATTGVIVTKPVEFGSDNGISRSIVLTTDYLKQRPLVDGTVYYFAVTSYSYNPNWNNPLSVFQAPFPSLESAPVPLTVQPAATKPGLRFGAGGGDSLAVGHTNSAGGALSDGSVTAVVLQPDVLTGDNYKVTFDGSGGWTVTDVTTNTVKLTGTNQTGDANYLTVDGVQVIVAGPPPGMKDWSWTPSATRFWTWVNGDWGAEGFGGAIGNGYDQWFSGSTVTYPMLRNVDIQFATTDANGNILDPNDPDASYAYRYMRSATAAAAQPSFAPFIINATAGYAFQDYNKSMPMAAYNMETTPPTRLMVGYLENNQVNGLVDGKYWPPYYNDPTYGDNIGSSGPREWFYIFDVPYSTTPDPSLETDILNNTVPLMWFGTITRRNTNAWTSGNTMHILANHINTADDVFTFTAPAPTFSTATAQADVNKINVYPNPYYGVNANETNRLAKYVRFTHLPAGATIRIFTLAGVLVRTLPTTDGTSTFTDWNLRNDNSLPVASGIYIAYIDMPSLGKTKTLKIAIVQEDQILPTY